MASEAQKQASKNYLAKLKTWTIRIKPEEAERIEQAATAAKQSKNEYVLEAVRLRMKKNTSGKKEKNAPGGELKITDTPSNQDKALSCSLSPAQKEALEEVLCSIIQDTPRDQRDALKVELNQIICECTDKINKITPSAFAGGGVFCLLI